MVDFGHIPCNCIFLGNGRILGKTTNGCGEKRGARVVTNYIFFLLLIEDDSSKISFIHEHVECELFAICYTY